MPTALQALNRGDAVLKREFSGAATGTTATLTMLPGQSRIDCAVLFNEVNTGRDLRDNANYERTRMSSITINKAANPQVAPLLALLGVEYIPDRWLVTINRVPYAISQTRMDISAWTLDLEGINP